MTAVAPSEVFQYLLSRGVSRVHALGMLSNIQAESGFQPLAQERAPVLGAGGYGLFQHTGPRRRALEQFGGVSDWRRQIDFALSEPETKDYLAKPFQTPEAASAWFTKNWERPAEADKRATERLGNLPGLSQQLGLPSLDVRTASSDSELPPEMQMAGDPMTGRAPMAQPFGSLPPELGESPFSQKPPSLAQRLAQNPFIQMGLGIMSSPSGAGNSPLIGISRGMQSGLTGALGAEQTQFKNQDAQTGNWLYLQQLRQQQARMMGLEQMSPAQRMNYEIQQGQLANTARELDMRESGLYNQRTEGDTESVLWGIVDSKDPTKVRYASAPKGQSPEITPDERLFNAQQGGAASATGDKGDGKSRMYAYMIGQLAPLMTELENNPKARNSLGTLGAIGARVTAALGMLDKVAGWDTKSQALSFFGGLDPGQVKADVDRVVLPIAKTMVDPSGPLANQEQARAALQAGIDTLQDSSTWKDPDVAFQTLKDTLRIMQGALQQAGGSLPPEMGVSDMPSRPPKPPGDGWEWSDEYKAYVRDKG